MSDWVFKNEPFKHQLNIFHEQRDKEFWALLADMGTGKTFITLNTASWLYAQGKIDLLVVIAPNSIVRVWTDQTEEHVPDYINARAAYYTGGLKKWEEENLLSAIEHENGLKIIAMNVESLTTSKGLALLKKLLISFRTLLVIDESTTIKNPKAIRTKNLLKLSVHAKYRRILTGTPVTQGPLDLFTQFTFLDSQILRCGSYFAFRNRYAVMKEIRVSGGRIIKTVDSYQNLDELTNLISKCSTRITKAECLDLPEKLYSKRYVELSGEQRRIYNAFKKKMTVELNGKTMSAPLALTRLMRLQQIVGGFFQPDSNITIDEDIINGEALFEPEAWRKQDPQPIDEVNPRVESLIELLGEVNGKVIIWARFRSEISEIARRINETFGKQSVVEYHGGVDNQERTNNISRFQQDDGCRFFIGHVAAGGKGITLHAASTVVYYSNDFSLENRLQSEDRAHRIGQTKNVLYIDMIAVDTLDKTIVDSLRGKKNIADLITGDEAIEKWI